jgi:translation initiation factor eIF-2B subunit delta
MENPPDPPVEAPTQPDLTVTPSSSAAPNPTLVVTKPEEKKISGAELKKQQKAEKAAKRAKAKAESGAAKPPQPSAPKAQKKEQQQTTKGGPSKGGASAIPPAAKQQTTMPSRPRRLSTGAPAVKPPPVKQVSLFGHLYGHPRRYVIEGATKEVHPAILALGLQMSSYEVCGSTARCVAMLLAFKSVR